MSARASPPWRVSKPAASRGARGPTWGLWPVWRASFWSIGLPAVGRPSAGAAWLRLAPASTIRVAASVTAARRTRIGLLLPGGLTGILGRGCRVGQATRRLATGQVAALLGASGQERAASAPRFGLEMAPASFDLFAGGG